MGRRWARYLEWPRAHVRVHELVGLKAWEWAWRRELTMVDGWAPVKVSPKGKEWGLSKAKSMEWPKVPTKGKAWAP